MRHVIPPRRVTIVPAVTVKCFTPLPRLPDEQPYRRVPRERRSLHRKAKCSTEKRGGVVDRTRRTRNSRKTSWPSDDNHNQVTNISRINPSRGRQGANELDPMGGTNLRVTRLLMGQCSSHASWVALNWISGAFRPITSYILGNGYCCRMG